jgi:hypothetical protein
VKVKRQNPERVFKVGRPKNQIDMKDCGKIVLEQNEQVTFTDASGVEYDVARKDWGFYATPSLNGRLKSFGLSGVLIKNKDSGRFFVLLVEDGRQELFNNYCEKENLVVITWMNSDASLNALEALVG